MSHTLAASPLAIRGPLSALPARLAFLPTRLRSSVRTTRRSASSGPVVLIPRANVAAVTRFE
ncbi:hypothetical protein [Halorussus halophilus]|uniref:hypothetical protein n=1 Tax=Halorussus halophilus TaxID=2650975 RepID=UPI001300DDF7|nr:hypothetical protein [Halorussus halophilus]